MLPQHGGFAMTGYSVNDQPIVSANSIESLNLTDDFDDADEVIVTLYGYVEDLISAEYFVNTALVYMDGRPAQTKSE